jgi:glycosyltransferase involved in cell wall biosynthesis
MKIHVISTVNGQVNEGMRNVATHLSRAFEAEHEVRYSGLKDIASIICNSIRCDATMIFARANKMVYWLARLVTLLPCKAWIVCVQKPDEAFTSLNNKHPLKANYLTLLEEDLSDIKCRSGYRKVRMSVGIKVDKFSPVTMEKQRELKQKYGFAFEKPLVIHVGHCSSGRGLEDFAELCDIERMIVASGMFENADTVNTLQQAGVRIHKGYLEHVEEVYQMADAYLFPTHSAEYVISIPLSVMEALSCGVPVVAYKDFSNLLKIPAEENAITLIADKSELNTAIGYAAKQKQKHSLLKEPKSWETVADEVLEAMRRYER